MTQNKQKELTEKLNNICKIKGIRYPSVGIGWAQIIIDCIEEIDNKYSESGYEILQIKAKFGGLRIDILFNQNEHSKYNYEEFRQVIDKYEDKSYTICELCGEKGSKCTIYSYIWTLCEKCWKNRIIEKGLQEKPGNKYNVTWDDLTTRLL